MPLTCRIGTKDINTFEYDKEQIRKWSDKGILKCQMCDGKMIYRHGEYKIPHFAHECTCEMESQLIYNQQESEEHVQGKKNLYEWLKNQDGIENLRLEAWIPETKQRPDIYFEKDGVRYVLEYQCAVISTNYAERHRLYELAGIKDIWILGGVNYGNSQTVDGYLKVKTIEKELIHSERKLMYLRGAYLYVSGNIEKILDRKTAYNVKFNSYLLSSFNVNDIINNTVPCVDNIISILQLSADKKIVFKHNIDDAQDVAHEDILVLPYAMYSHYLKRELVRTYGYYCSGTEIRCGGKDFSISYAYSKVNPKLSSAIFLDISNGTIYYQIGTEYFYNNRYNYSFYGVDKKPESLKEITDDFLNEIINLRRDEIVKEATSTSFSISKEYSCCNYKAFNVKMMENKLSQTDKIMRANDAIENAKDRYLQKDALRKEIRNDLINNLKRKSRNKNKRSETQIETEDRLRKYLLEKTSTFKKIKSLVGIHSIKTVPYTNILKFSIGENNYIVGGETSSLKHADFLFNAVSSIDDELIFETFSRKNRRFFEEEVIRALNGKKEINVTYQNTKGNNVINVYNFDFVNTTIKVCNKIKSNNTMTYNDIAEFIEVIKLIGKSKEDVVTLKLNIKQTNFGDGYLPWKNKEFIELLESCDIVVNNIR